MTRQKLLRANELQETIDRLFERRKKLEEVQKLCREDADIAKKTLHDYFLQATLLGGGRDKLIKVSPIGALRAVSQDISDIEKEIEKLSEEFDKL